MESFGGCVNGQWETKDSLGPAMRRASAPRPPLWLPHGQQPTGVEHANRPLSASGQAHAAPGGQQLHAQRGADHDGAAAGARPPPLPLFAAAPPPAQAPEGAAPRLQFSLHAVAGGGFPSLPARAEGEPVGLGLATWPPAAHHPASAVASSDGAAITEHLLRDPHPLAFTSRSYEEAARAAQLAAAREAQAAAAAAALAAGAGPHARALPCALLEPRAPLEPRPPRRSRLRRPCARRSLSCMFDLAASLQDRDQQLLQEELAAEEAEEWAEQAGASRGPEAMDADAPCCSGAYPDQAGPSRKLDPAAPLLPLQHLLMSERAQQLAALEVKAIVYRVCSDLAARHSTSSGHCGVSISSIALAPNGDLATTRLLPKATSGLTGCASASGTGPSSSSSACAPLPPLVPHSEPGAGGGCCALGFGARWAGRRQGLGLGLGPTGISSGAAAYVPPEVACCGCPSVADFPSADMWSLGVVLFVLLSGGYVPFGHRGLCQTCIPNMPGPTEKVDRLQDWLEAHLYHKVEVIQEICRVQAGAPLTADVMSQMRVVGFDELSRDLLLSLLRADPAQRLSAAQALRHPWLLEVAGLVPGPEASPLFSTVAPGRAPTPSPPIPTSGAAAAGSGNGCHWEAKAAAAAAAAAAGGHMRRLSSGSSDGSGASCFSPSTPTGVLDALTRGASVASLTPTESVGSDMFSFSDLFLLSGAVAASELAEGCSPHGAGDPQPYRPFCLQQLQHHPRQQVQQYPQQQVQQYQQQVQQYAQHAQQTQQVKYIYQPQPAMHDSYAAALLAGATAAAQQAPRQAAQQQAPMHLLAAEAPVAPPLADPGCQAGECRGNPAQVGPQLWGQAQAQQQAFSFSGFVPPPPPALLQ